MTDAQQKKAAKEFAEYWKGKGYEKGESQKFWLSLLRDVYGVEHPEQYISFEDKVFLGHTSFIDGYISDTKVLIEQKALGKDLKAAIKQSDGTLLTPFQQAKRYVVELPVDKHPKFIVTCNFHTFLVYDMNNPSGEPEEILLENLEKDYYRLSFLTDTENIHLKREMELSIQAGDLVGILYDALLKQYKDPTNPESLKSLNMLCVRIVFCLYAEDAGLFGKRTMFHDYMARFDARDSRKALIELFQVLDQPEDSRDPYLDKDLAVFPYVNGGLFSDEHIEIPNFTDEIRNIILSKASEDFDWSEISPTIFGAVFESTLNPETRRSGGMHYTAVGNIHKVIDPLFLDELRAELNAIKEVSVIKTKKQKLLDFQDKLASLKFLDPACGSGNFLTETYLSLRRLENEAISEMTGGQITFAEVTNPIKITIQNFSGIEINDFAVTVAKTALWIAESQMMKETEAIIHMNLEFLPLKTNAHIVEGNALRIDWESVVPKTDLNYIMGNPPFVGYAYQTANQKEDLKTVMPGVGGNIDYVAGWYFKASQMMQGTKIHSAFVSTNSITQGEQVVEIWKPLYEQYGIHIDFAHRTFIWDSEANMKAHVHCVIIGFNADPLSRDKKLYSSDRMQVVDKINPYLVNSDTVFINKRNKPLCDVPQMIYGNKPVDGGNLILSESEYFDLIQTESMAEPYIHLFLGAEEFLNGKKRYCLWLQGISPKQLRSMPYVLERVERVRSFRMESKKAATQKWADNPTVFIENRQPNTDYIAVPEVSSGARRYVPMDFLSPDVICSNKLQMIPDAGIYEFGVLMSNVHMAWVRTVCGRLKSDYDYSAKIVYNNFPWPMPTEEQKVAIEKTAQAILDARSQYPDCSLADLYYDLTMPSELRKAHQENDKAVMEAYGFTKGTPAYSSESACVAELMKMYQELTKAE